MTTSRWRRITSLDSNGEVATLGPLITGEFDSAWGNTGLNILSTVFQSVPFPGQIRPSQKHYGPKPFMAPMSVLPISAFLPVTRFSGWRCFRVM